MGHTRAVARWSRARWFRLALVICVLAGALGAGAHALIGASGASVQMPLLDESSGLAASHRNPGILWSHNDSGGRARLFAFTTRGEPVATLEMPGIFVYDWEDLAIGPDAAGQPFAALYVGDIGDNFAVRQEKVQVYRLAEPDLRGVVPGQPVTLAAGTIERFDLGYEDGPRDAETLMVDPRDGALLVVTKDREPTAGLYRVTLDGDPGDLTLHRVADVPVPGLIGLTRLVTGGAIAPDARFVVVRTYVSGWWWPIAPGQSVAEAMSAEPTRISLPPMRQGEAITVSADGQTLYVTSEGLPTPLGSVPAPDPAA